MGNRENCSRVKDRRAIGADEFRPEPEPKSALRLNKISRRRTAHRVEVRCRDRELPGRIDRDERDRNSTAKYLCDCGRIFDNIRVVDANYMSRSEAKNCPRRCSPEKDDAVNAASEIGVNFLEPGQVR